jgi:predicted metallo-beta-lactamase superfamily hydrolase
MDIKYIAFDSFGVKSSCILVKTPDVTICVDPGIAEQTKSFPLPLDERLALEDEYRHKIGEACSKADVITVSHYHYDHHQLIEEWYKDKIILIKDPINYINKSQKGRAEQFYHLIKDIAKEIKIADNNKFVFGDTKIEFSIPLWHGKENTSLGYVLMATITTEKNKILHSSDIMGPYIEEYSELIIKEKPNLLILDGAPTYLLGYIQSYYNFCRCILNLRRIIKSKKIPKIILDHHCLRDYRYKDLYHLAFQSAKENNITLHTAAEEIGKKPAALVGFEKNGPSKWKKWDKLREEDMKTYLGNAIENKLIEQKSITFIKKELKDFD